MVPTATSPAAPPMSALATPSAEATVPRLRAGVGTPTAAVPTQNTSMYPAACTPTEVEAFLGRFFDAFNRGDLAALRTFFPDEATGRGVPDHTGEKFVWYSVNDQRPDGSRRHFVAHDLPTLWAYFAERHAHHETLRLANVLVRKQDAMTANLTVFVHRAADDVPPEAGDPPGQATGKAVVNCRDQTIRVWSIGQGRASTPTPAR